MIEIERMDINGNVLPPEENEITHLKESGSAKTVARSDGESPHRTAVDGERLAINALILHYRIERVLGQGGFGITYLAVDTRDQTPVAIKEYYPRAVAIREDDGGVRAKSTMEEDIQLFEWGLDRFRKELLTLAKFEHDNIIKVLYFFEALNTVYLVMPFVEGESLTEHLKRHPVLSEQELLGIVLPLLDALAVMHHAGYLHRDIKPDNIFIQKDGRPVLLDFGTTRQAMGVRAHSMTVLLTPAYSPIEQNYEDSTRQGPWSDIFSMGAVMYHAVTGKKPSPVTARLVAISDQEEDPLPCVLEIGKGKYREHFLLAIEHALRVSEKDRPKTVDEWRKELLGEIDVPKKAKPPGISPAYSQEAVALTEAPDRVVGTAKDKKFAHSTVKGVLVSVGVLLGIGLMGWGGVWFMDKKAEAERQAKTDGDLNAPPAKAAADSMAKPAADHKAGDGKQTTAKVPPAATGGRDPPSGSEFIRVPGGVFMMGCGEWQSDCDTDENPIHSVKLASFEIGKFEVTQGRWKEVMGNNPAKFHSCGMDCPVEQVSWEDVQEFIKKLNGRKDGFTYRLPTEAEWEYACRSRGKEEKYCGGNDIKRVAWYDKNSGNKTHPVGQKDPNGLGLYDMGGNVYEWVFDWYLINYYEKSPNSNPLGPAKGTGHGLRGGSWNVSPFIARSSTRLYLPPDKSNSNLGFRLIRESR